MERVHLSLEKLLETALETCSDEKVIQCIKELDHDIQKFCYRNKTQLVDIFTSMDEYPQSEIQPELIGVE